MYLKRIELQGFKSFVDKTEVIFQPRGTSVIEDVDDRERDLIDAINWALGEQSTKALNIEKLEDVIFSGNTDRKASGFAEVSVIFDNSNHWLPLEYSEVRITRRIYRFSGSEYFINALPCRLKDIHELFLDTGIGKNGFSIILQKNADFLFKLTLKGRRPNFEEATGIMKYKVRKASAIKQLKVDYDNLQRIDSIVSLLDISMESERGLPDQSTYHNAVERHGFMLSQREEIESSRDKHENVIRQISESARTLFLENIDTLNLVFKKFLKELYETMDGEVSLLDHEDPLESGIEIKVKFANGDVLPVKALSGKTRTYAAVAMLLAMNYIKKSPFIIFNHIETLLIDIELSKIYTLLENEFSNIQLIYIMENKNSML